MLALAISTERFETITGRSPQIIQSRREFEHRQLSDGPAAQIGGNPFGTTPRARASVVLSRKERIIPYVGRSGLLRRQQSQFLHAAESDFGAGIGFLPLGRPIA